MTRQVRNVAVVVFLLFGALFLNLNYLQVLRAGELSSDNRNVRVLLREYEVKRGSIAVGEGPTLQEVVWAHDTGGQLRFLREYLDGPLYAHITGFHSHIYGRTQLEGTFNEFLSGASPEALPRNVLDFIAGRTREGDDVLTTIRPAVQAAARDALGDRAGAVVALQPRTGEILALWSYPTFDPARLSSADSGAVRDAWADLNADPSKPLVNRALREWYPPGSVFKIVTAAAALEAGVPPDRTFEDPRRQELPLTTATIGNFGGGLCNNGQPLTFVRAMEVSCNTTFAQLGLELGGEQLAAQAERFGINQPWDPQLPLQTSRIPHDLDPPSAAQSAIGQRDVRVTPLQMAVITAAVANDGVMMRPRVVNRVQDFGGRIIREYPATELTVSAAPEGRAMSVDTAHRLRDMMVGVVASGTGRRATLPNVVVAGKTGTAQHTGGPPTVWFVGFAPADDPQVAVAVVLEEGGGVGDEATGGAVAAPIAQAVIAAALTAAQAE